MWIGTMLCVTVSSFWIRELNSGALSWIHGLTVWTLFSMFVAVVATRTGRVRLHAGFMVGTMVGTVAAGGFALAPGRFTPAARLLRGPPAKAFEWVRAAPCRRSEGRRDGRDRPAHFDPYRAAARVVAVHVERCGVIACLKPPMHALIGVMLSRYRETRAARTM